MQPLRNQKYTEGIYGVKLNNKSISNDLPDWMVRHRNENFPDSVVQRRKKDWNLYNQEPKGLKKVGCGHTHSGDSPQWMTEQIRRINPASIKEPPSHGPEMRQFENKMAPKSHHDFPKPHENQIKQRHRTRAQQEVKYKPTATARDTTLR